MSTLCLIDLSSIWWQQWHSTEDQEVGAAYRKTLDKVHRYASGHDHVAICCDSPPYKRSEIYPEYKANRTKHTAVALEQFQRVQGELGRRYPVLSAEGYEADDVIATIIDVDGKEDPDRRSGFTVVSGDKDLMQLVSDQRGVSLRSTQSGQEYGEAEVTEKFGVAPSVMDQFLALVGDPADNIPGVPKVGTKTAAKLLADHQHLVGIVAAAKDGSIGGVVGQNIVDHEKQLGLSYRLVQLMTDAPVDVNSIFSFESPKEEPVDEPETIETESETVEPKQVPAAAVAAAEAEERQRIESIGQTAIMAAPKDWTLQLEPRDSLGAWKLAQKMHQSRMFGQFPNPEAILAVMLRGRALGFDAATALSNFHVVEGRPVMSAHLIIGLVLKNPVCERLEFTESTDEHSTWTTKRKGAAREQTLTYTIDEARKSGLVRDRGPWQKYPAAMLRKTCGVLLARAVYPDITAGLYCAEEL